jgi:hypothetical protein
MMSELRIWWIPQVPMDQFYAPVESIREAKNMLACLASYDEFQFENNIKPDYCNVGGLQIFEDGEWTDWCSEDGYPIDEVDENGVPL